MHIDRRLTEKVREEYNHDNVQVNTTLERIEVYWMNGNGRLWIPFSGGPLYNESAKDHTRWLARHIEGFRELLPKKIRQWPIVVGELATHVFPGIFREC